MQNQWLFLGTTEQPFNCPIALQLSRIFPLIYSYNVFFKMSDVSFPPYSILLRHQTVCWWTVVMNCYTVLNSTAKHFLIKIQERRKVTYRLWWPMTWPSRGEQAKRRRVTTTTTAIGSFLVRNKMSRCLFFDSSNHVTSHFIFDQSEAPKNRLILPKRLLNDPLSA